MNQHESRRSFINRFTPILAGITATSLPSCMLPPQDSPLLYEYTSGDKRLVVFSHETLGSMETMRPYAEFFQEKGHSTLLWDYPPYLPSIPRISRALEEVMSETFGSSPVFCGYSLGGMVSIEYALSHPNNYSGIILIGSAHAAGNQAREAFSNFLLPKKSEKTNLSNIFSLAGDLLAYRAAAEVIEQPVLVIAGDNDQFFPLPTLYELRDKLARKGAGAVLEVLSNEDHGIAFSNQSDIFAAIDKHYDFLFPNK